MKRTQKLDDEREISLGMELNGKPGFVKAGTLRTTEADKEQTSSNIMAAKFDAEVEAAVNSFLAQAEEVAQHVLANVAPHSFWEAYEEIEQKDKQKLMLDWIVENQFQVILDWDNLKIVIKMGGKVLLDVEATLPAELKSAVIARGKLMTAIDDMKAGKF